MMYRYLVMREHMTGICMRQWSALEKLTLNLILINVLLRPYVAVFLVTRPKESRGNQTDASHP